jgi:cyclohexanone monooxygenase
MDGDSGLRDQAALDVEALRARYRAERDKRLRDDGHLQYIQVEGEFAGYAEDDPYIEDVVERAPLTDEIDVAVIGGGFSGMLACARLKELGVTGIRLIEAGGDFGGTWYWNRYPGAQCDIESYCYLPLLEELNYVPKEKYSYGTEIYEHSQRIGRAYGLYDLACFQTRVRELRWDAGIKRWRILTNRGDDMKARFVVMCLGTASRAKMPGLEGIHDFEGHSFHTSRWDYGYTGGDTNGNLHKLADKKVAIIGTGATAIQCVPHLGASAEGALRLPADPLVGGPARQQAHRPGLGERAAAGVAARAAQQPERRRLRRAVRGEPGQRRLDRDLHRRSWPSRSRTSRSRRRRSAS